MLGCSVGTARRGPAYEPFVPVPCDADGVVTVRLKGGMVATAPVAGGSELALATAPVDGDVLASVFSDGRSTVVPIVVDPFTGTTADLPVDVLSSALRWETNIALVGQIASHDGTGVIGFRLSLGKSPSERLPEPAPTG